MKADVSPRRINLVGISSDGEPYDECTLLPMDNPPTFECTHRVDASNGTTYVRVMPAGDTVEPDTRWPRFRDWFKRNHDAVVIRQKPPTETGVYLLYTHYGPMSGDNPCITEQYCVWHKGKWYWVKQNTHPAARLGMGYLTYRD